MTKEELEKLGAPDRPDEQIADSLGVKPATIRKYRFACGLLSEEERRRKASREKRWTKAELLELGAGTLPDRVFAEKLDCSLTRAFNLRQKFGIPSQATWRRLRDRKNDIEAYLAERDDATRTVDLARHFKVSKDVICRALRELAAEDRALRVGPGLWK